MHVVEVQRGVLEREEVVRRHHVDCDIADPVLLHCFEAPQRPRLALTEIDEDQAEIFLGWIARDVEVRRGRHLLGRPLDTLALFIEHPAVIEATEASCASMYPTLICEPRCEQRNPIACATPSSTAIDGEILVEDLYRRRVADGGIFGAEARVPERAHVAPGERPRSGVDEIDLVAATRFALGIRSFR